MGLCASSNPVQPSKNGSTPLNDFTDLRLETKRVMDVVQPQLTTAVAKLSNNELNLDRKVDREKEKRQSSQQRRKNKKNDPNIFTDTHIVALVGTDQIDSPLLNALVSNEDTPASPSRRSQPTWQKITDAASNKSYYFCEGTGETTWDKPDEFIEHNPVTTLSLCDHRITGKEACESIARIIAWQVNALTITTLRLRENYIEDEGAEIIAQALFSPGCTLQHLELQGNSIGDVGIKALASSFQGGVLQTLSLDRQQKTRISEIGIQALADALLKPVCQLRKLSLSGNKSINCECATLLANAVYTKGKEGSLQELYLSGTGIKDKGAVSLSRCLKLLTNLSLSGCRIKDIGGDAIAKAEKTATKLRGLDIQGNEFSPVVIQALVDNASKDCMVSVSLHSGSTYAS